jgi:hypothetical protein
MQSRVACSGKCFIASACCVIAMFPWRTGQQSTTYCCKANYTMTHPTAQHRNHALHTCARSASMLMANARACSWAFKLASIAAAAVGAPALPQHVSAETLARATAAASRCGAAAGRRSSAGSFSGPGAEAKSLPACSTCKATSKYVAAQIRAKHTIRHICSIRPSNNASIQVVPRCKTKKMPNVRNCSVQVAARRGCPSGCIQPTCNRTCAL